MKVCEIKKSLRVNEFRAREIAEALEINGLIGKENLEDSCNVIKFILNCNLRDNILEV